MDLFRDLLPGELPFVPGALKKDDLYNNYVRSSKLGTRIYYHPDEIKGYYDIFICSGVDVHGNEYRIIWDVNGVNYTFKEVWRFDEKCGTWCRW